MTRCDILQVTFPSTLTTLQINFFVISDYPASSFDIMIFNDQHNLTYVGNNFQSTKFVFYNTKNYDDLSDAAKILLVYYDKYGVAQQNTNVTYESGSNPDYPSEP